eukprot:5334857-Amphidinium_carterae.3
MSCGHCPAASTTFRNIARSSTAISSSKRSSPMLHLSTPLAFPSAQRDDFPQSPVLQEEAEVLLLG